MSGLELLKGLDRLSISQCQSMAKDLGYDNMSFDLVGPTGRLKCSWLDAYFGFFQIEGQEGFITAKQFEFAPDIYCQNLALAKVTGDE